MNTLDLIVVAVVALSGLFAFVRGFVREALSIAAWLGAAVVTFYGYDAGLAIARGFISSVLLAQIVAGGVLFIGSLILFAVITGIVSTQVRESSLGALDRALGLLFGVIRGAVLVCLGYLAMTNFLPPESRPNWIVEARSAHLLEIGAIQIRQFIPRGSLERGSSLATEAAAKVDAANKAGDAVTKAGEAVKSANDAIGALTQPKVKPATPPTTPPGGYKPEQQQELNRLFQATEGPK